MFEKSKEKLTEKFFRDWKQTSVRLYVCPRTLITLTSVFNSLSVMTISLCNNTDVYDGFVYCTYSYLKCGPTLFKITFLRWHRIWWKMTHFKMSTVSEKFLNTYKAYKWLYFVLFKISAVLIMRRGSHFNEPGFINVLLYIL